MWEFSILSTNPVLFLFCYISIDIIAAEQYLCAKSAGSQCSLDVKSDDTGGFAVFLWRHSGGS